MTRTLRVLSGLLAAIFAFMTLQWLLNPVGAAETLGMPLLEGTGGNAQIGDFTAFFFSLAVFIGYGAWQQLRLPLYGAALLLGAAALFRIVAALAHGTTLDVPSVAIEVVSTAILLFYASRLAAQPAR